MHIGTMFMALQNFCFLYVLCSLPYYVPSPDPPSPGFRFGVQGRVPGFISALGTHPNTEAAEDYQPQIPVVYCCKSYPHHLISDGFFVDYDGINI